MRPYSRQELERKRQEWQAQLDYLNGQKIARVAASLHPYRPRPVDGSPDKHEAASPGRATASTTATLSGESRGCSADRRD